MAPLQDLLPQHILQAAPLPDRCFSLGDYLDHLMDEVPELVRPVLPHAGHEDLAELVMTRMWRRDKVWDRQTLADVADHPECDTWIGLSILLRMYPGETCGPEVHDLVASVTRRINDGTYPLRYSETPVICARSLEIHAMLSKHHPHLRLTPEAIRKARIHAEWIERGRAPGRGYAMFDGRPILAANLFDPE